MRRALAALAAALLPAPALGGAGHAHSIEPSAPPPGFHAPEINGRVVDAASGAPVGLALVQAAWVLRLEDGSGKPLAPLRTRRIVKQVRSVPGGRFQLPEWRSAEGAAWQPVPGSDPVLRIYAPGYARVSIENVALVRGKRAPVNAHGAAELRFVAEGAVHPLRRVAAGSPEMARELLTWRRDADLEIARHPSGDAMVAMRSQLPLLLLIEELCSGFAASRPAACPAAGSPLGRFVADARAERSRALVLENPGTLPGRYALQPAAGPAAAAAAPDSDPSSARRRFPR